MEKDCILLWQCGEMPWEREGTSGLTNCWQEVVVRLSKTLPGVDVLSLAPTKRKAEFMWRTWLGIGNNGENGENGDKGRWWHKHGAEKRLALAQKPTRQVRQQWDIETIELWRQSCDLQERIWHANCHGCAGIKERMIATKASWYGYTMGQIIKEPRCKYWPTRSSVCMFACTAHSLTLELLGQWIRHSAW